MAKFLTFSNSEFKGYMVSLNIEHISIIDTVELMNCETRERQFTSLIKTFDGRQYQSAFTVMEIMSLIENLTEI